MIKAVFPGSFDPPTNGHLDIIHRASKLFDNLDVLISVNPNKQYMFSEQERLDMLTTLLKDYKNVQIHVWEGLIVNNLVVFKQVLSDTEVVVLYSLLCALYRT